MKKHLIFILSFFLVLALNGSNVYAHSSMMDITDHNNEAGPEYDPLANNCCAAICSNIATLKEEEDASQRDIQDDEDTDESTSNHPQSPICSSEAYIRRRYVVTSRPPPKVPIYILNSVFRV